jgi:hypothetical protein
MKNREGLGKRKAWKVEIENEPNRMGKNIIFNFFKKGDLKPETKETDARKRAMEL